MPDPGIRGSSAFPGPPWLGRGAVVHPGQDVPEPLDGAPRVRVEGATLDDPEPAVAALRAAWAQRRPVVVELGVDAEALTQPEVERRAPHELDPDFFFPRDQLRFLVWANTYDLRSGTPVWWHGVLAQRAGAQGSDRADVALGSAPLWVDGGPRGPVDAPATPAAGVLHREAVEAGCLEVDGTAAPQAELADDQLRAVAHRCGPARVIAPAGSGKTRVLTSRLRHLLADRRVQPGIVTAVAFNRRAAGEMAQRLTDVTGVRVRTIHALGYGILRATGRSTLLGEREIRDLVARLARVDPEPNRDVIAPFLEALGEVRLGLADPDDVERARPDVPGFARLFHAYRQHLVDRGLADFDEQIYGAVEALLVDPELRERCQRRCRHVLVDEFQDLTPAFVLLLRLLAAPAWQVYGVGDDDQTIYGHVGADPAFLVSFDRLFPHAGEHALEVNYRCPPAVVRAASGLVRRNHHRVPKTVRAAPGRPDDGRALEVLRVERDRQSRAAVERVRSLLDGGADPSEVAVLCRVNALLLPVQVALLAGGVPASSPVGPEVLRRTGMRTALAWLRLATAGDRLAGEDLAEVARRSARRLRGDTLRRLAAGGRWTRRRVRRLAYDGLQVWEGKELRGLVSDDLGQVVTAARTSTAAALAAVREVGGLDEALRELDSSTSASRDAASHVDDLDALAQTAALHPEAATFEAWLTGFLGGPDRAPQGAGGGAQQPAPGGGQGGAQVRLATIHTTKGLEFDHVVLYAVNDGLMPHRLAGASQAAVEEERRVLHVGLTRCRRSVAVIADRGAPSPFLDDLGTPTKS